MSTQYQDSIRTSKLGRATRLMTAGIKIGANYVKHYSRKAANSDYDLNLLDEENAEDIYSALSELKGSALKAAQMLSMDRGVLPEAFVQKFQEAQFSAPPLSYPLVVRTFRKHLGCHPLDVFDTFSRKAVNAASIGQVHLGTIGDKRFAVKVQYPGVAESVESDLRVAKPLAARIMNVRSADLDVYMKEVKERLLEETDYELELRRSVELSEECGHLENIDFSEYFPEYSSNKILTMEWMEGKSISEWLHLNPSQEERNKLGQTLWNFYNFQIHHLGKVHADPHPGNFLVSEGGRLIILDFGCVKDITPDFYETFKMLHLPNLINDEEAWMSALYKLDFLIESDTEIEKQILRSVYEDGLTHLLQPYYHSSFDFADKAYFDRIYEMFKEVFFNKQVRDANMARGPQDSIYLNRTYFGMYSLLHLLGAQIDTSRYHPFA